MSEVADTTAEIRAEIERLDSDEPVRLPWTKLVLDKMLSGLALVLSSPLWLVAAAGIKADGLLHRDHAGPVFYRETRVSAGERFPLPKFRIMKVSAIEGPIEAGVRPKDVENDPANVTGAGRVLKKTGLDELPQFASVLTGRMSLIGPRPKPVAEYEEEIARGIWRRKVVRAGISGPAQLLKGTSRTAEDDLLADLRYIERLREGGAWRVLALDLGLLGRTVRLMLRMTGE